MSKNRMNVVHAREYTYNGEKRVNWTTIGVAFENNAGTGFNVELHYIPQTEGPLRIQLLPPNEKSSNS